LGVQGLPSVPSRRAWPRRSQSLRRRDSRRGKSRPGGAIPYQLGRFEASTLRRGTGERFSGKMRNLSFDTVLCTEDALRLLIKTVGADRCLFGSECPDVGSAVNRDTGHSMDYVRLMIENIEWLSATDRKKIFEDDARSMFKLKAGLA
jgi:OH-DDVA meta-cleavage compound hydrolase